MFYLFYNSSRPVTGIVHFTIVQILCSFYNSSRPATFIVHFTKFQGLLPAFSLWWLELAGILVSLHDMFSSEPV